MCRNCRFWFVALNLALAMWASFLVGKVCANPGPAPLPDCKSCTCRDVEALMTIDAEGETVASLVFFYKDQLGTPKLSTQAFANMVSPKDKCQLGAPTAKQESI